jgi:hypothetical protein
MIELHPVPRNHAFAESNVGESMITHPEDGGHPDGLNWLTLDESGKNAYICGFIEGLFQGHCFTTWGLPGEEQVDRS